MVTVIAYTPTTEAISDRDLKIPIIAIDFTFNEVRRAVSASHEERGWFSLGESARSLKIGYTTLVGPAMRRFEMVVKP